MTLYQLLNHVASQHSSSCERDAQIIGLLERLVNMSTELQAKVNDLTQAVTDLQAAQALVAPLQEQVKNLTAVNTALQTALDAAKASSVDQSSLDAIQAAITGIKAVTDADNALTAAQDVAV